MNTLSMLLPVYNARDDLQLSVGRLLDLAAEMSDRFELCVLDDGSTDDTGDTLSLLAACYPQIRLVRHPVRLGLAESIQTGLDNSDCETIVFGHGQYSLDPYDLLTLWRLRDVERRAADASRGVPTVCDDWLERLEAVGSAVRSDAPCGSPVPDDLPLDVRATAVGAGSRGARADRQRRAGLGQPPAAQLHRQVQALRLARVSWQCRPSAAAGWPWPPCLDTDGCPVFSGVFGEKTPPPLALPRRIHRSPVIVLNGCLGGGGRRRVGAAIDSGVASEVNL